MALADEPPLIVGPDIPAPVALIGGKASALHRLRQEDLPIPVWFVITPHAFAEREGASGGGDAINWEAAQLSPRLVAALQLALREHGLTDTPLAVRSSSVEEDGSHASFAGQFESYLGVGADDLPQRIIDVWRSGYADRVAAYKAARTAAGSGKLTVPAVIVQRMVPAEAAGVAFSVDPVSARWNHCLVSAVFGLGSALVDGETDADNFAVDRSGAIVSRAIAAKRLARTLKTGPQARVEEEVLPEAKAAQASISDADARRIAALARSCEARFGRPQDIEWALQDGELFLLQSRPITTLRNAADPDANRFIWDNSNIAESYEGVTTPLTFSFARYIYTEVYRQFCLILKVPNRTVEDHRPLFAQMLGLVEGRVYYNLLSWYRMLALLPGFTVNRGFMEQMMGVKEALPDDALKRVAPASAGGKLIDSFRLARSLASLVARHFRIQSDIQRFNARLQTALSETSPALETMRLDQLTEAFHQLESQLLTRWDAPLVNDFIAMIFFGALKSTCQKWLPGEDKASLHNELLCDMGDIISAQPARRIQEMATIARRNPRLVERLRAGSQREIRHAIESTPDFRARLDDYFAVFGDRCLSELKLESLSLIDDPMPLFRSIGELAAHAREGSGRQEASRAGDDRQSQAEAKAFSGLSRSPIRRFLFKWILKHARRRVQSRENLRFERTRLFGRIRRIFIEIGKRLHAVGVIDEPRDIFYLEIFEIIGFVEGTASFWDLRGHVALRKTEYAAYREKSSPADRFETYGAVPIGNAFRAQSNSSEMESASTSGERQISGIGCCPGIVRGKARVARDPQTTPLKKGEILVALQTDPGWIMLFPLAAGLLVERGSLLSHSAIVSRELGLPAIVSIKGLMDTLETGDEIEMDGSTGRIAIISKANDASAHP